MPGEATPIQAISLEFVGNNEGALNAIDTLITKLEKLQSVANKGIKLNISSQLDKTGTSAQKAKKSVDDLANSINQMSLDKMSVKGDGIFEPIEVSTTNAKKSVADLQKQISETIDLLKTFEDNVRALGKMWATPRLPALSLSSISNEQKTPLLPEHSTASVVKLSDALFTTDNALKNISKDAHEAYRNLKNIPLLPAVSSARKPYQPLKMNVEGVLNTPGVKEQTIQYHGLTAAVMGAAKAFDKLKKSKVGSLLTKEVPKSQMSLKSLSNIVKHTTGRFNKLLGSIKRVALYRAIRAAIKAITNGFKEGVENLYAWSNAFDSTREFANSMDKIATAALYVKNSLGALVAPIINTLAPALDYLADKFVGVLNIINEFLAAITGASTYTVAKKIATQFKEAEEGASGAAKALKSFTIGIDELNIIEDTGRSGGGAGGLSNQVEDWFEKQEVSNKMKQFVDDLKIYGDGVSQWAEDTLSSLKSVADFWGTLGKEDFWDYMKSPEGMTDTLANVAAVLSPFPLYALGINAVVNGIKSLFELFEKDPLGAYSAFFTNAPLLIGFLGTIQDFIKDPVEQLKRLAETILKIMPLISPLFSGKQGSNFLNNISHPLERLKTVWNNFKTGLEAMYDGIKKISELIASGWEYNLKEVKKVLDKIWGVIQKILAGDIDDLWSSVVSGSGNNENASRQGANLTDSYLSGIVRQMAASTGVWGVAFGDQLKKFFAQGKSVALNQGIEIVANVKNGFTSGASSLYQKARDVGTTTLNAFKSNASYASFKSAGENIVNGIIAGLDAKKGSVYKSISVLAEKTGSKFNYTLKIQSPSKVFAESGKWIVAGLNKGIEDNERSTAKVVDNWLSTFKNLSADVDISNVSMPGMASIMGEVDGNIRQSGSVSIKNETEDVKAFFEDVLMPVVNDIAADAKRQADKRETTEVYMDSRKVTESVNRQNRANGYSFTGV